MSGYQKLKEEMKQKADCNLFMKKFSSLLIPKWTIKQTNKTEQLEKLKW